MAARRQFTPACSLFCVNLYWIFPRKIGHRVENVESLPWCGIGHGGWGVDTIARKHNSSLTTKALSLQRRSCKPSTPPGTGEGLEEAKGKNTTLEGGAGTVLDLDY